MDSAPFGGVYRPRPHDVPVNKRSLPLMGVRGWVGRGVRVYTTKRCGIHLGAETPFLARSTPINEWIRPKIRFWCWDRVPRWWPWIPGLSTVKSKIRVDDDFEAFLGHFNHPRTIPDQSGKIDFLTLRGGVTPLGTMGTHGYTQCTFQRHSGWPIRSTGLRRGPNGSKTRS